MNFLFGISMLTIAAGLFLLWCLADKNSNSKTKKESIFQRAMREDPKGMKAWADSMRRIDEESERRRK